MLATVPLLVLAAIRTLLTVICGRNLSTGGFRTQVTHLEGY